MPTIQSHYLFGKSIDLYWEQDYLGRHEVVSVFRYAFFLSFL